MGNPPSSCTALPSALVPLSPQSMPTPEEPLFFHVCIVKEDRRIMNSSVTAALFAKLFDFRKKKRKLQVKFRDRK